MATSNIQAVLELGHVAFCRRDAEEGGLTHDWVVFLRGPKENPFAVHHFIRKVVFHLHPSFQNPHRVVEKPPYEIRESGYAGFMLPIDVHLKGQKDELPYKIRFDYDLTLFPDESCNCLQTEKLTFRNPSFEFRRMLLDGGGCGVLESDVGAILPDRRLMQTFEHPQAGLNRFFAGPLPDCIPNFEEFAKLFGLALPSPKSKAHKAGDSSGRSRKASTGSSASSTGEIPKLSPLMASSDLKSDKRGVSHSSALKHVTKALMDKGKISSGSELAKPSKGKSVKSSRTSIQEDKDGLDDNTSNRSDSVLSNPVSETRKSRTSTNKTRTSLSPSGVSLLHADSRAVGQLSADNNNSTSTNVSQPLLNPVGDNVYTDKISNIVRAANTASDFSRGSPSTADGSVLNVTTPGISMSPRTNKSTPGPPLTPFLSDEIRHETSVPRMLSPLSSPEDQWSRGGLECEDDDALSRRRRSSTGFLPSHRTNGERKPRSGDDYLMDLPTDGFISGISDPSDFEDSPPPPQPARLFAGGKRQSNVQDNSTESYLDDLRDVRISNKTPISPLDDHECEDTRNAFGGTPPKLLTDDEEYERYKLQVVLSQLDDRKVVQSIVDLLTPLGAYIIDEKAGIFSFNLYMLDDRTIENVKKLARFDEYCFEEEDD